MQVPLEIVFEDMDPSDAIDARLREEAGKLEQFTDRITSTRVVVAKPHRRHQKGNTYRVRIHITMPGGADIVVNRDPGDRDAHEDVYVTIRDAFRAAGRQLQDQVRKLQGHVKTHETPPHGVIESLVPQEDHGFISTSGGRVIYFHRNAVADDGYDALEAGQEVRFSEDRGDEGPQASFVQPIGKHHLDWQAPSGQSAMRVQVESYAGHRGDQTPRRFRLDGRIVEVEEILDQWQGRQPLNMQPWLA